MPTQTTLLPLDLVAEIFPGILDLGGRLAASTLVQYRRDVSHYLAFCGFDGVRARQPEQFRAWRVHMAEKTRLSPHTINRRLAGIKRLVRTGAELGLVPPAIAYGFTAVDSVRVSTLRTRLKPHARTRLTPAQVRRLCQAPDARTLLGLRDRALLATLAGSGCRVSEVVSLTQPQIVWINGGWFVEVWGKRQSAPRHVSLAREAYDWIQRWLKARAPQIEVLAIFTGFVGAGGRPVARPLTTMSALRVVWKYAALEGIRHVKAHDFRRFVGTQVYAKYGMLAAQRQLGHERPETTARHYILEEVTPGLTDGLY